MTSQIPISVIIPAYNHERFVRKAIDSVLNQTWKNFELIIIDDGSTDRTFDIIRSYTDSRICASTQKNQDAFNTINKGISRAAGTYIAILNSDDEYHPERLERLYREAENKQYHCIFTHLHAIDAHSEPIAEKHHWNTWHNANRSLYFDTNDLLSGLLNGNLMVTTSNLFIRNTTAQQVGPFAPIRYLHDYDYILRVINYVPDNVAYLDEDLLAYRIHDHNTLKQGAIEAREQDQKLIREHTLLSVPEECRNHVKTGINRLMALEKELHTTRYALQHPILFAIQKRLAAIHDAWSSK